MKFSISPKRSFNTACTFMFCTFSTSALANKLPVIDIGGSGGSTDYVATAKNIIWGVLSLLALIVTAKIFFSAIDGVTTRFDEWKSGNATIGGLVGMSLSAVALLAFGIFLLTQLSNSLGFDFSF